MATTENPTAPVALVLEKDGNLAGKRMLTTDLDAAVERAGEIDGQAFALELIEPNPAEHPPVSVVRLSESVNPLTGLPFDGPEAA